mgnify:CR=1 FL=1
MWPGYSPNLPGKPCNGPPGVKYQIWINQEAIKKMYGENLPTMVDLVLAHELCHGTNLWHHRKGPVPLNDPRGFNPCLMQPFDAPKDKEKGVIVYNYRDAKIKKEKGYTPYAGFLCNSTINCDKGRGKCIMRLKIRDY